MLGCSRTAKAFSGAPALGGAESSMGFILLGDSVPPGPPSPGPGYHRVLCSRKPRREAVTCLGDPAERMADKEHFCPWVCPLLGACWGVEMSEGR